jgi:hypothetical protein
MKMPIVSDDGTCVRPLGRPDECFYCREKLGKPHKSDCVVVTKEVKVRYTFEVAIRVPYSRDAGDVEFHRNGSSWCADNAIKDITSHQSAVGRNCLCGLVECSFLEVIDPTPRAI